VIRLLVPIDLSECTEAAIRRACEIAGSEGGTVTGLTVLDTEGVESHTALPFHAEYRDYPHSRKRVLLKDAAAKLDRALVHFEDICRDAGVAADQARSSGNPADAILDLARFYDLMVIGLETHFHFEIDDDPGDTLTRVLDGSPVPILAVPDGKPEPYCRALVAFDGSPAATRALHAFAGLWPIDRPEVKILTCERDKHTGGHLLDQAQKYLQAHGVPAVTTELTPDSPIEAIESGYLDWADLIVAGVRSQHPIQHLFVGSFARFLIENSQRNLLLCQ
jgi:nucleotide-binding universal stress UspA family protein